MATYEGDPTQVRPPADAPIDFNSVKFDIPASGSPFTTTSIGQLFKHTADWLQLLRREMARIFGDGAAGDVTIAGSGSPIGLDGTPRYNDLEVQAASEFSAIGGWIRVLGTLQWDGKISGNGRNGANGIGGGGASGGGASSPYRTAGPGGNGMLTAGNAAPNVISPFFTSAGAFGAGGLGSSGAGGASANQTQDPYTFKIGPHVFTVDPLSGLAVPYRGGRGGGGGGGDGANSGGGGGESGQCVFIFAREVVFGASCSADAIGGNGGNSSAGNCGGGAGGQGGCFVVVCGRKTGTPPAVTVTGGTGGAKTGTGVAGQNGAAGRTTMFVIELGQ